MIRRSLSTTLCLFLVSACGGSGAPRTAAPAGPAGDTAATNPSTATPPATPASRPAAVGNPRTDLIPRAVLFGNPERGAPQLSPDGKMIAYSAPVNGVMNVFVAPADDLGKAVQVTFDTVRPIRTYNWSVDSRFVLYQQDIGGDENFHLFRVGIDGKGAMDLTDRKGVKVQLIGASIAKPDHILVGMNDRNPQLHDVYDVEISSGTAKLVLENPGYVGFVADDGLKLRHASQFQPDGTIKRFKSGDRSAAWVGLDEISSDDQLTTNIIGYERSGKRYYEIDARGRDTAALYAVDARSGKRTLLAENPKADVGGGVIFHPRTGVIRAVAFNRARPEWKILDKSIASDLAALAKLDEGDFFVTSMSLDDKVWIVGYNGDRVPTRFWRWDRKARKGTMLYSTRPALDGLPLARMHPHEIPARDGLPLVSYLSLPPEADPDGDGAPAKAIPMVLFVHGGPWARDGWGYHPVAQLLANRGYAVLQVNYRGSTGFGKNFINAANREWGKKMHDDLIDAVGWAVEKGITTSDQVCIMGGSYGGYATLAGLTLTPQTFKCGVDIVGPSSLITLAESAPPYWKPILAIFKTRMGDWTTPEGREAMLAVSPITHVAKIERPLLIGQGANDPRVTQAESDQIVKAMKAKGLPVTYVLFPDEGHGFARPENNIAFMAIAEAFLSAHLGGSYEPAKAEDYTGSSLRILEGADGIPGLPKGVGR